MMATWCDIYIVKTFRAGHVISLSVGERSLHAHSRRPEGKSGYVTHKESQYKLRHRENH